MANWILERTSANCCPWPAQCRCRPRVEARAAQNFDLSVSGDSWEAVLSDLLAVAG